MLMIYKSLINKFQFSGIIDMYTNRFLVVFLEIYITFLFISVLCSFYPFYYSEPSNGLLIFILNFIFIVSSGLIFIIIFYRIVSENVNINTNLIFIIFFIILELLTHLIRLISITLRICANSTSGHILMIMIINIIYFHVTKIKTIKLSLIFFVLCFFFTFFLSLEIIVSLIQIYVIVLLLLFYLIDIE